MVYSFTIKSQDRISGTRNNGTYMINFRILDDDVKYYNLHYTFYTSPNFYLDHIDAGYIIQNLRGNGWITSNLPLTNSTSTNGSTTNILGHWVRQCDNNADVAPANITATTYLYSTNGTTNVYRRVLKPTVEMLTIQIINAYDGLPVTTNDPQNGAANADMSDFILNINLEPIFDD